MRAFTLTHLSDRDLARDLAAAVARERGATAVVVAHIPEFDSRRLYLPAGYPSMYEYCVRELRLSEYAALKRIRAGRTARRFPGIFTALAEGRLHLSGVLLLTPYLTSGNADQLLAAAALKTKSEIEELLALRFPRPDLPTRLQPISPSPFLTSSVEPLAPGPVEVVSQTEPLAAKPVGAPPASGLLAPGPVEPGSFSTENPASPCNPPALERVEGLFPRVTPLSPGRYAVQFTMDRAMHDDLRYAQSLVGHQIPSGDLAQVFSRALNG